MCPVCMFTAGAMIVSGLSSAGGVGAAVAGKKWWAREKASSQRGGSSDRSSDLGKKISAAREFKVEEKAR